MRELWTTEAKAPQPIQRRWKARKAAATAAEAAEEEEAHVVEEGVAVAVAVTVAVANAVIAGDAEVAADAKGLLHLARAAAAKLRRRRAKQFIGRDRSLPTHAREEMEEGVHQRQQHKWQVQRQQQQQVLELQMEIRA